MEKSKTAPFKQRHIGQTLLDMIKKTAFNKVTVSSVQDRRSPRTFYLHYGPLGGIEELEKPLGRTIQRPYQCYLTAEHYE